MLCTLFARLCLIALVLAMALTFAPVNVHASSGDVIVFKDKNGIDAKVAMQPVAIYRPAVIFDAAFGISSNDGPELKLLARVLASCNSNFYAVLATAAGDIVKNRQGLNSLENQNMNPLVFPEIPLDVPKMRALKKQWCSRPPSKFPTDLPVAVSETAEIAYIRLDSVRNINGMREVWVITNRGKKEPVMVVSSDGGLVPAIVDERQMMKTVPISSAVISKVRYHIKCGRKMMMLLDAIDYNEDGSVKDSFSHKQDETDSFSAIIPDSMGEGVANFVCEL